MTLKKNLETGINIFTPPEKEKIRAKDLDWVQNELEDLEKIYGEIKANIKEVLSANKNLAPNLPKNILDVNYKLNYLNSIKTLIENGKL